MDATQTPPGWEDGPMIAVGGATASGKSSLAMAIAEKFGGEIINTDSLQVYRHLDIGTAKPGRAERARIPHHLIDLIDPDQPYSAGRYVTDAKRIIAELPARKRLPVLCGGTGLYLRSLLFGLADVPGGPAVLLEEVERRIAVLGAGACHRELAKVDPAAAAAIHPNDPARIARALSVYRATGRPLSAFRREGPLRPQVPNVLTVGIRWPRAELYGRINRRVREMLAGGWIEEVEGLLKSGYGAELKPLRSIGYREIIQYLSQGGDREELASRIATRTRRYGKRQTTWFEKHPGMLWTEPGNTEPIMEAVKIFLKTQGKDR